MKTMQRCATDDRICTRAYSEIIRKAEQRLPSCFAIAWVWLRANVWTEMVMTEWLHPWLESVSQRDDKAVLLFTLLAPVVFAVIIRSWTKAKQEEAVPFVWTAPRESRYVLESDYFVIVFQNQRVPVLLPHLRCSSTYVHTRRHGLMHV